ncbi:MAG: hypothetical protein M3O28_09870 [Actinomycetota bacterium]|nr:hypothetical protein [Actinomycetota bacterium]
MLASYADEIAAQFQAAGAPKDFAITEKKACAYKEHTRQDLRIGFTPLGDPTVSTLWLVRLVLDGPDVVLLQTIVNVPKAEQVPDLAFVRTIQHRLVDSVTLP